MKRFLTLLVIVSFAMSLLSTTIYDVQYTEEAGDGTYPSPMVDQIVTVTGIVTATNFKGYSFYICDLPEVGVGAWHGVYMYNFDETLNLQLGDIVEVTGSVTEYYGLTEINNLTAVNIISSGNAVPATVNVTTNDLFEASTAEQYEGVLCSVHNVVVTVELDDHNQWYVSDGTGECQVDDGFFYLEDEGITVTVGDTWGTITGLVDYSYDEYGITPRFVEDMIADPYANNLKEVVSASATLIGNYPNPFNPTTEIQFNIEKAGHVNINIFNTKGQLVKTLANNHFGTGLNSVKWNGLDNNGNAVASGVYFYNLDVNNSDFTSLKKMILLK